MRKILWAVALALIATPSLAGCNVDAKPNAEKAQQAKTNQLLADADARVGMPRVTNFTEKRLANMIMELRDQPNLTTYTYTIDMNGRPHCLGKSIGFGIPYAIGITSPEKMGTVHVDNVYTLPQAEPNGLYTNGISTTATWVLLVGKDGKPEATYVEPEILVSLEPLKNAATPC